MINVLLCRWKRGWREVIEPQSIGTFFRHEAMFSLGAVQSPEEVDRIATMQLKTSAWTRTAVACDHDPIDKNDRPYRSYNVGDTIIVPRYGTGTYQQRVRAITGSEDDDGNVTYAPELGDLLLEEDERTLQLVKKMSDGTLNGESPAAQPTRLIDPPLVAQARIKPRPLVGLHSVHPAGGNGESDPYQESASITITKFRMKGSQGGATDELTGGFRVGSGDATSTVASITTTESDFDLSVDIPAHLVGALDTARFYLFGGDGLTVEMWAGDASTGQWIELPWWGGG